MARVTWLVTVDRVRALRMAGSEPDASHGNHLMFLHGKI